MKALPEAFHFPKWADSAVPERPWWSGMRAPLNGMHSFQRLDGRVLHVCSDSFDNHAWFQHMTGQMDGSRAVCTALPDEKWEVLGRTFSWFQAFAWADEKYPMAPPALTSGQLWGLEARNACLGPYLLTYEFELELHPGSGRVWFGGTLLEARAAEALLHRGEVDVVEIGGGSLWPGQNPVPVYSAPRPHRLYTPYLLHDPLRPELVWAGCALNA